MANAGLQGIIFIILLNGPFLFATVLLHELGHVTAARRCGFKPDHILLWPLGGLAYISKEGITPKEQIFVSSAGPATHLPMLLVWALALWLTAAPEARTELTGAGLVYYTTSRWGLSSMCFAMLTTNFAMLAFNLLVPCIPLDCSQILVAALLMCGFQVTNAAFIMVCISVPVCIALALFGIVMWVSGSSQAMLTVLVAAWLGYQTWQLWEARRNGELMQWPLFRAALSRSSSGAPSSA